MVAHGIGTARAAGTRAQILVCGGSAYGTRAVAAACIRHDVQFSLVMTRNRAAERALDTHRGRYLDRGVLFRRRPRPGHRVVDL